MPDFSISVIIPVYNRITLIDRALQSVYEQTRSADEIIVVNDGSTDNIETHIREQHPAVRLLNQSHQGVSAARNTGIRAAGGNWISLLDSDDSWQPQKLERQCGELAKATTYSICHTNETWYRNGKVLPQKKKHRKQGGHIFQHCLPLCAISPSSVIIRKTLFDEIGLFDERLPACEDYDMWLRICSRHPVLFIDEALTNKFGGHINQLSQMHWGMDRFRIQALQKCIESNDLNDIDRQAAIQMLLHKIDIFIQGSEKHGTNTYSEQFMTLKQRYA